MSTVETYLHVDLELSKLLRLTFWVSESGSPNLGLTFNVLRMTIKACLARYKRYVFVEIIVSIYLDK